jgi:hypothetical protein
VSQDPTFYDGTMNTRIIDSVTTNAALLTGQAPSQAFGILDTVMAETLGMSMHNAVMRQQADGMVNAAAMTATCAKMLQSQHPQNPPPVFLPVQPEPPKPDHLYPPQPPPAPAPVAAIAQAIADGEAALDALKRQAADAQAQADAVAKQVTAVEAELAALAKSAAPPPPPARNKP